MTLAAQSRFLTRCVVFCYRVISPLASDLWPRRLIVVATSTHKEDEEAAVDRGHMKKTKKPRGERRRNRLCTVGFCEKISFFSKIDRGLLKI